MRASKGSTLTLSWLQLHKCEVRWVNGLSGEKKGLRGRQVPRNRQRLSRKSFGWRLNFYCAYRRYSDSSRFAVVEHKQRTAVQHVLSIFGILFQPVFCAPLGSSHSRPLRDAVAVTAPCQHTLNSDADCEAIQDCNLGIFQARRPQHFCQVKSSF
jgi:hypothetical protein